MFLVAERYQFVLVSPETFLLQNYHWLPAGNAARPPEQKHILCHDDDDIATLTDCVCEQCVESQVVWNAEREVFS